MLTCFKPTNVTACSSIYVDFPNDWFLSDISCAIISIFHMTYYVQLKSLLYFFLFQAYFALNGKMSSMFALDK